MPPVRRTPEQIPPAQLPYLQTPIGLISAYLVLSGHAPSRAPTLDLLPTWPPGLNSVHLAFPSIPRFISLDTRYRLAEHRTTIIELYHPNGRSKGGEYSCRIRMHNVRLMLFSSKVEVCQCTCKSMQTR